MGSTTYFGEMNKILNGDALKHMKQMPENSVDAVITDPPYGLEFMGKEWDSFKKGERKSFVKDGGDVTEKTNDAYMRINKTANRPSALTSEEMVQLQEFCRLWARACLRVLKPGGFLLSFGGTRTYHRMVCGIEDVGFEIRDTIMWLYGSGFPKSLNIGKQIDKIQGNEREVVGKVRENRNSEDCYTGSLGTNADITKGSSEWEGWGTALKPACEPIVVARKPLSEKNVALNVLKWGTGGINVDECRIESGTEHMRGKVGAKVYDSDWKHKSGFNKPFKATDSPLGRFPANIIFDEEAGKMLDEQTGILMPPYGKESKSKNITSWFTGKTDSYGKNYKDIGGASRFFYCAKASKSERNFGLGDEFEEKPRAEVDKMMGETPMLTGSGNPRTTKFKNNHPTVKPIKLMEYLIKLVTRKDAIVLDPFLGSGTTAIACIKLNRNWIGIEKEDEYIKIAEARIKSFSAQKKLEVE